MPLLLARSSGIEIPVSAAEWGYNSRNFHSTFPNLGRVDTNNANTSTAGTDWWVTNDYESTIIVPASSFSIVGGNLRIKKGAGNLNTHNSPSMQSYYRVGSGGYHGRTFKNGGLFRYVVAFDETIPSSNTNGFPALWMASFLGETVDDFVEIDTFEALPSAGSISAVFFKHGQGAASPGHIQTEFAGQSRASLGNPVFNESTFHTVDVLWVPTYRNSGVGLFDSYFDGIYLPGQRLSYTLTGLASVGSGGFSGVANYNGAFSVAETSNNPNGFGLYITAGNGGTEGSPTDWPLFIQEVSVFQASSSDMVVVT